ncbi:hypothetical protein ACQPYA_22150 [Micromonospora sp. CA-263727]|uniref:hypothetical protein n=1 Tax=Micromonospora sp. CA-263727 TaxID=3239967 RepID=UPI003D94AD47
MSVRPAAAETGDETADATGDGTGDATGDATGDETGGGTGKQTGDETGGRTVLRLIASAPWVVVLLAAALLVVLLVVAVLSFRGPERPAESAPVPPMSLPIPAAAGTPAPTESPSGPSGPSRSGAASPTPSGASAEPLVPSRTASPAGRSEASRSPAGVAPEPSPSTTGGGTLAASYRVLADDEESFQARLVVSNGSGASSDWRVELRFTGEVTGVRASSGPGVSVTIKDRGWYLLSGTGPLNSGAEQTVQLRFTRTGGGEYPAQCTVNGSACALG